VNLPLAEIKLLSQGMHSSRSTTTNATMRVETGAEHDAARGTHTMVDGNPIV
jgi:hypothetical protein